MPAPKPSSSRRPDDPTEYPRFLDMAREVGVDESPEAFDRAFEKVIPLLASKKETEQP